MVVGGVKSMHLLTSVVTATWDGGMHAIPPIGRQLCLPREASPFLSLFPSPPRSG